MKLQLNNYQIKLLAAIFMLIDHVGAIFFPTTLPFRMIGRLSFPLYAWLLTQGEKHTRNFQQYLTRLILLGLISQPFFSLAFRGTKLNILFTLTIGLISLRLSRKLPEWKYLILVLSMVAAELLRVEYGAYGIAAIYLFSRFQPSYIWWLIWVGLHILLLATSFNFGLFQLPAFITPLLIHLTNNQKGAAARWFYSFYPLHLLILFLLAQLINSSE